ncbi:hypothetical protein [Pararhodobacter sp.]|uniref:hypothetical protein n=1 Tax=Pararhodobacter sp. TaxID=2127056 RepID=UPI002FDD8537
MEIAIHLGAHLTDEDRLIRCLMRNRAVLARDGISIPGTSRYRTLLRRTAHEMRDTATDAETQEALLDSLITEDTVNRVVFSSDCFLSNHRWAIGKGQIYPDAAAKVAGLRRLFPSARVEFYMAIRNPATFLPALAEHSGAGGAEQVMGAENPLLLRWSETLGRIHAAVPDCRLTVWCDEDTPLLWPEILREVSGHPDDRVLEGVFDWYRGFVSEEGLRLMGNWLAERPPMTDLQRRKVLSAFLDKFALPEKLEVEATLPGWQEDHADILSELYAQDVDLIAQMPGVDFLEA